METKKLFSTFLAYFSRKPMRNISQTHEKYIARPWEIYRKIYRKAIGKYMRNTSQTYRNIWEIYLKYTSKIYEKYIWEKVKHNFSIHYVRKFSCNRIIIRDCSNDRCGLRWFLPEEIYQQKLLWNCSVFLIVRIQTIKKNAIILNSPDVEFNIKS